MLMNLRERKEGAPRGQGLASCTFTETTIRHVEADRFRDARIWGAPVIGPHTVISAPFGWTGLARIFGERCGQSLVRCGIRFSAVSILPSGLCLEMEEFGSGEHFTAIHAIANEIAQAAPAVAPESGLLTWPALREFVQQAVSPDAAAYPCPRPEFRELWSAYAALSKSQRGRCLEDIERLREGFPPAEPTAPFLDRWGLVFLPGTTTVSIWGEANSHSITDTLFAIDRLRRWACGGRGVYRLNRHFHRSI
jgi:hypothetical protein